MPKLLLRLQFHSLKIFQDPSERLGCSINIDEALDEMKSHAFFRTSIDWELVRRLLCTLSFLVFTAIFGCMLSMNF